MIMNISDPQALPKTIDSPKPLAPLRLAWFTTARDQAALDLLRVSWEKKTEGFYDLDIPVVLVSRDYGESPAGDRLIDWARNQGLTVKTFSARRFQPVLRAKDAPAWREAYDLEVKDLLARDHFDWIFLAGYMWIVSPLLIRHYRILNLHPAPPGGPKGTWQEVIWETLGKRLPEAGAQIHLVTAELDEGPPLTYVTFPLETPEWESYREALNKKIQQTGWPALKREEGEEEPFFSRVRAKELALEFPLIWWTFKTLGTGRLKVEGQKVFWDGEWLPRGYRLNREITEEGRGEIKKKEGRRKRGEGR